MGIVKEHYRCDKCGCVWDYESTACPSCHSELYVTTISNDIESVQELQFSIKKWSDETFGKHRLGTSILHHLRAETDEVINALAIFHQGAYGNTDEDGLKRLSENRKRVLYEFADCFMLLIDAAAHEQISIEMLVDASKKKLEINKQRKWGPANELGYFEHIEE